ncbi:hypothetical protein N801_00345 [Knoellia aerolata DSM 18566]|uniref:Methyltransferase domain-containing protein n=2 Tax=Knoellia TaxID=136099 RepID=A0A0A0K394_9MICO|nr:hypothetical protein N801_00345 [Knoellia aerolata DSM 18566]
MTGRARLDHPEGELRWVRDPRWGAVPAPAVHAVLAGHDHLLVVAAHPDDECLGAGAFIADAAALGIAVTVLVLTEGEASHPHSPTVSADEMARRRGEEADRAAAVLAPTARVVHAGLPDGGLAAHHDRVVAAVRDLARPGTLVLAPWTSDGHPDHDAAGRGAVAAVAESCADGEQRLHVGHYLVWLWHWGRPDALPWADMVVVDATLAGLDRRDRALSQHHSQLVALSPAVGDEALLGDTVLAPFRRGFTALVLPGHDLGGDGASSARAAAFDGMFTDGDDPWATPSWYERRKRALTLAVLGDEHYGRVLDLGCSTGVLTRALAVRADELVAVDVSERALAVARRDAPGGITWVHGEAPSVLDAVDGPLDLVVLSEVGYFLRPVELWLTLGRVLERLAPGGELVLVHWRHPTSDIPLDGPAVHAQVRAVCGSWSRLTHVEPDVLVDTYAVPR